MSGKKSAHVGGTARRKGSKRGSISKAGVKKLLKLGASVHIASPRVSEAAVEKAVDDVQIFLEQLSTQLMDTLRIAKKSTLTPDYIRASVVHTCADKNFSISMASGISSTRAERSSLSGPGIITWLKDNSLDGKTRIGDKATEKLVGITEAYVKMLGVKAGLLVKAAKRSTVMASDIQSLLL